MDPHNVRYQFNNDGTFRITHYNRSAPFASFLPGIAGPWGIPMWAFYVNRGQGMSSFGLRDKDHPITEFLSANWASQLVFDHGFRTFIKVHGLPERTYEPFRSENATDEACTQTMLVAPDSVGFHERHEGVGLEVLVRYFTLTDEPLAALVRTVEITNISSKPMSIELLDGLPMIVPHGLDNFMLKNMRNLAPCFCLVTGLPSRVPGFRAKTSTADDAVVEEVEEVNFFFGFEDGEDRDLLETVVDPQAVFGASTYPAHPEAFHGANEFRVPQEQRVENLLPCSFLFARRSLAPGQKRVFQGFFGHAPHEDDLANLADRAREKDYVEAKRLQARNLIASISQPCRTVSSHNVLNAYALQNLLDNRLRGGAPTTITAKGKPPIVLPLYSRKHGDPERDYNPFVIEPTYFSQGEGNYRDVNQNRRHDVFFNPDVGAENVISFFNMIQADGFNPLVVKPKRLICRKSPALLKHINKAVGRKHADDILRFVHAEFEIGRLFVHIARKDIRLSISREAFLAGILEHAEAIQDSAHGIGYWSDHWTYNLDLLESFRGIYPDRYADLLFNRKSFVFCDTHVYVRPRSEKYVLCKGKPVQLHALRTDKEKEALINSRTSQCHAARTKHGAGEVYTTTLGPKLLALAATKVASLDPHGIGIEMDSERPNWYDALNGLPGQFGSSTCETFELKRLLVMLDEALGMAPRSFAWNLPVEIAEFVRSLTKLLAAKGTGPAPRREHVLWDKISTVEEKFRVQVEKGFAGPEKKLTRDDVAAFVSLSLARVDDAIRKARDRKSGLYHSYYRQELTGFTRGPAAEPYPTIVPKGFKAIPLPLFLEGQVHAMRVVKNEREARAIYEAVRKSDLYDKDLRMYKVNASLEKEPLSIGRTRTFARGWLENESVWVHMEYKYLLEILRSGLAGEFFEEFKRCGVPFLSPERYGRSTTENSSFIASSAYVNPADIGRGFMARLSGATAEFIHMWIFMCCGERPFRLDAKGKLEAVLQPTLPGWLFTRDAARMELVGDNGDARAYDVPANAFGFVLLGHTAVVYRQAGAARNTFGKDAARVSALRLTYANGTTAELPGNAIPEPHASALRNREIELIEAELG